MRVEDEDEQAPMPRGWCTFSDGLRSRELVCDYRRYRRPEMGDIAHEICNRKLLIHHQTKIKDMDGWAVSKRSQIASL